MGAVRLPYEVSVYFPKRRKKRGVTLACAFRRYETAGYFAKFGDGFFDVPNEFGNPNEFGVVSAVHSRYLFRQLADGRQSGLGFFVHEGRGGTGNGRFIEAAVRSIRKYYAENSSTNFEFALRHSSKYLRE